MPYREGLAIVCVETFVNRERAGVSDRDRERDQTGVKIEHTV